MSHRGGRPRLIVGQAPNGAAQILVNEVDDGVDIDPIGHVRDEKHQHRHAAHGQGQGDRDGQVGYENGVVAVADRPQNHQGEGERPQIQAQDQLVATVSGEMGEKPRPHLTGGEGQGRDGYGKDGAGHAYGGRGHSPQQGAGAAAAARVEPSV